MPALSISLLRNFRLYIVLLVTALVAFSLLLIPGPALGIISVSTVIAGETVDLPVGSTIPTILEVEVAAGDLLPDTTSVDLIITGPQGVLFASLLLIPGAFQRNVGGGQDKVATLTGNVTHVGIVETTSDTFGYAGANGYTSQPPGTIAYDLEFTHQILLDPEPATFPLLPQNSQFFNIDVPGAVGGFVGGEEFDFPQFPDFESLGEAFGTNVPFDGLARALDARIVGPEVKLGAVTDGFGENDVYAQLVKGEGFFMFVESDFVLPDITGGVAASCPGPDAAEFCDMGAIQAIAFVNTTDFVVAGGDAPDGSDAFAALLRLNTADSPTGASVLDVEDLSGVLGGPPGGAAYDSVSGLVNVSEFEDDPGSPVSIALLDPAASLALATPESSYTTPLGFVGLPGFSGLGITRTRVTSSAPCRRPRARP